MPNANPNPYPNLGTRRSRCLTLTLTLTLTSEAEGLDALEVLVRLELGRGEALADAREVRLEDAVPAVLYLQQLEAAALSRHGDAHRAGVEAAEWREGRAMQGETRAARRETGGRGVAMAYAACSGGPDWRRGAGHGVAERTYSLASPNPNPNPTRKGGESTADLSASSEQVRVRVRDRVRVALAAAFACSRASL